MLYCYTNIVSAKYVVDVTENSPTDTVFVKAKCPTIGNTMGMPAMGNHEL